MFLKAIRGFISVSHRRELSTLLEFFNLVQHENQWRNSQFYYLRDKGIGGWLSPWQIKREGKAYSEVRRNDRLLMAQTEKEIEKIESGEVILDTSGSTLALVAPDKIPLPEIDPSNESWIHSFVKTVQAGTLLRDMRRSINFQKTILLAEEEARDLKDEEVSDKPLDPDWIARWRESVGEVSSEKMQSLWAKILAGECKQPGSFSLSTIECLKRLSTSEAQKIEKIGPLQIEGWIYRPPASIFYGEFDLTLFELLELEELGILTLGFGAHLTNDFTSVSNLPLKELLVSNKNGLLFEGNQDSKLNMPIHKITMVGRQILSLGDFEANIKYLEKVGEFIKSQEFKVWVVDFEGFSEGNRLIRNHREI